MALDIDQIKLSRREVIEVLVLQEDPLLLVQEEEEDTRLLAARE